MAATLPLEPQPAEKRQTSTDWLQQLQQWCHQPISPPQRLSLVLQLREKLFADEKAMPSIDSQHANIVELILTLAQRLCDWPMLIYLRKKIDSHWRQASASNYVPTEDLNNKIALAEAYHQQGLLHHATDCIRSALLSDYRRNGLSAYYIYLQNELHSSLFSADTAGSEPLVLTPLRRHHLQAYCWAYADPEIAELCNLPKFSSDQHWLDWQHRDQQSDNKYVFAVNHVEWGFIGSVSLEVFQGVGFFYYWLGAEFQGRGYGPQAVEILLELGWDNLSMDCCYAKVYEQNTPSQKGLIKAGFKPLSVAVKPPFDNERVFYWGPDKTPLVLYRELHWLLGAMESDLELEGSLVEMGFSV